MVERRKVPRYTCEGARAFGRATVQGKVKVRATS